MSKNACLVLLLISLLAVLASCKEAERSTDQDASSASSVLARAIHAHGALVEVDTLRFTKLSVLLRDDGTPERSSISLHHLRPNEWAGEIITMATRDTLRFDASAIESSTGLTDTFRLRKTAQTALFTATLPWRLLDESASISLLGDTVIQQQRVAALAVQYPQEANSERFVHYFSQQSGRHVGYFIDHGGENALVLNVADTLYQGLRLPTQRVTWRVRGGEMKFRRAHFTYRYE